MIENISKPEIWLPFLHLFMALIIAVLFIRFFNLPHRLHYVKSWQIIFIAFLIWLIEEALTIMDALKVIQVVPIVGRIIELIVIIIVLQGLFLQRKYIEETI